MQIPLPTILALVLATAALAAPTNTANPFVETKVKTKVKARTPLPVMPTFHENLGKYEAAVRGLVSDIEDDKMVRLSRYASAYMPSSEIGAVMDSMSKSLAAPSMIRTKVSLYARSREVYDCLERQKSTGVLLGVDTSVIAACALESIISAIDAFFEKKVSPMKPTSTKKLRALHATGTSYVTAYCKNIHARPYRVLEAIDHVHTIVHKILVAETEKIAHTRLTFRTISSRAPSPSSDQDEDPFILF